MSGNLLLDTNIVIALFANDPSVQNKLITAEQVFVPIITVGELYYGAHKSARVRVNLARIEQFAIASTILGCDQETARQYGSIKDRLRAKGRPIPENDIWIAAIAQQHQLILVSRDDHFKEITGLPVEKW